MKVTTQLIKPEDARTLLASNENNRNLNKNKVAHYANEIQAGKWMLTHQGICIDKNGNLVDGQHRLHACIKADMPFETLVAVGVEPETFKTVDVGKKRTSADVFKIEGFKNAALFSAIVRKVILWKRGTISNSGSNETSNSELLEFAEENRHKIEDLIEEACHKQYRTSAIFNKTIVCFLYWLLEENVNYGVVENYLMPFVSGRTQYGNLIDFRNEVINRKIRREPLRSEALIIHVVHQIRCAVYGKKFRIKSHDIDYVKYCLKEIAKMYKTKL